jgi:hypothetical protein
MPRLGSGTEFSTYYKIHIQMKMCSSIAMTTAFGFGGGLSTSDGMKMRVSKLKDGYSVGVIGPWLVFVKLDRSNISPLAV